MVSIQGIVVSKQSSTHWFFGYFLSSDSLFNFLMVCSYMQCLPSIHNRVWFELLHSHFGPPWPPSIHFLITNSDTVITPWTFTELDFNLSILGKWVSTSHPAPDKTIKPGTFTWEFTVIADLRREDYALFPALADGDSDGLQTLVYWAWIGGLDLAFLFGPAFYAATQVWSNFLICFWEWAFTTCGLQLYSFCTDYPPFIKWAY